MKYRHLVSSSYTFAKGNVCIFIDGEGVELIGRIFIKVISFLNSKQSVFFMSSNMSK